MGFKRIKKRLLIKIIRILKNNIYSQVESYTLRNFDENTSNLARENRTVVAAISLVLLEDGCASRDSPLIASKYMTHAQARCNS